ncbi:uncharacterized protein EV420DRAFT_1639257 [Desarmillaria tabescens]|uniref:Uncharacterized protein n=1 Tax=Armillaria tabescens TaxID=1929756 RepID=A0AA39NCK4_ARMTA|nr:uncharacterized protein EV420DRAFT_1639257 [Desarmillaria tabescens]KAK0463158.1 hypothetical protein EV420DRAFT_1639257 [Desarmillaria tabescens]
MANKAHIINGHKSRCTRHASRNRSIAARLGEIGVVKKWSTSSGQGLQGLALRSKKGKKPSSSTRGDDIPMTSNTAVIDDDIEIEDHDMHPPLPEPEEEPAQPEYLERGQRNRMIPCHFQDYLPAACIALLQQYAALRPPAPPLPAAPAVIATHSQSTSHASTPESLPGIETEPNLFGLYWQYKTLPSFDPDDATTITNLCDAPTFAIPPDTLQQQSPLSVYGVHSLEPNAANLSTETEALDSGPWFAPFMNPTIVSH